MGAEWLERCVNSLARLLDVSKLIKTSAFRIPEPFLLPTKKLFSEQSNACCLEDLQVSPSTEAAGLEHNEQPLDDPSRNSAHKEGCTPAGQGICRSLWRSRLSKLPPPWGHTVSTPGPA